MMGAFLAALCLPLSLAGCDYGRAESVRVKDAYVRLAALPGRPAAGYLSVHATAGHGDLVQVSSPQAGRVEMHETMAMGGSMSVMRPLARVAMDEKNEVAFTPGGRHLMIFNPDPALKPGGQIGLTLQFAGGAKISAPARLIAAGDDAPR